MEVQALPDRLAPMNASGDALSSILVNRCSVSYKKGGSGPPLIFFHGWVGDEDAFSPCSDAFARHFTVYTPAWPGYGRSSCLTNIRVEDMVEIARRLILAADRPPVTILGSCLGGAVAIELVRLYPELVERLILVEVYDYLPWYMYPLLVPHLNLFIYNRVFKSRTGFRILNRLLTTKFSSNEGGMRYVADGFLNTNGKAALDFLKAVKRFERQLCRERYHSNVPTIYVQGGKSFKPLQEFKKTAVRFFRNLTVVSMPESLHVPIAEQPELFSAKVLHLLGHPQDVISGCDRVSTSVSSPLLPV
ncbi:MAG: alpha/beta hydrolase [Deltaproteobacteria bacterium]|nr:alpha/beta hydrolase [Deltaproteobacteria bacterium]